MHTYKKEDKLYMSIRKFIYVGAFLKYFFSISLIVGSILSFLSYQNHAYDHINVFAHNGEENSFITYLRSEAVSFDLTLTTDNEEVKYENLKTPYSIKVPKGEQIKVLVKADSKMICCRLENGGSSVSGGLSNEMKLERIDNRFKIECP